MRFDRFPARRPNQSRPRDRTSSVEIVVPVEWRDSSRASADAFAGWVTPHLPAMSRLASRLAPSADRDDIVQEALVQAWRKRHQFSPDRGTPRAWLLAIAADRARKARPRRLADLPAHVVTPLQAPSNDRDLDLEHAVTMLSGRQRLAIDCFYFVGLSVAETAQVMRCSEGTVKSTLSDARERLRRLLEVAP